MCYHLFSKEMSAVMNRTPDLEYGDFVYLSNDPSMSHLTSLGFSLITTVRENTKSEEG
jgi:hypothetical protein